MAICQGFDERDKILQYRAVRALIIHGGFSERELPGEKLEGMRQGLLDCVRHSWDSLASHSALETVVEAVRWLEDDPRFNAGTGSKLQADGRVRMSAALMDGSSRLFSGVVNVERVQNPILLARRLQGETFTVLAGEGATAWARQHGFPDYEPVGTVRPPDKSGTVGACALDDQGRLAAATSTGGRGQETVGRVSDSATVAGNYADAEGAVSCTGLGEEIVHEALAARLVCGGLERSFEQVFADCRQRDRHFGAIGLDRQGRPYRGECQGRLFWALIEDGQARGF